MLTPSVEKEVKDKIVQAEKLLVDLKKDLDRMTSAGIPSTFLQTNYNKVKDDLDKLKAVYG